MACPGIRDETEAVRPLPMCAECEQWQASTGPVVHPRIVVVHRDGMPTLACSRRIAAKPLPESA